MNRRQVLVGGGAALAIGGTAAAYFATGNLASSAHYDADMARLRTLLPNPARTFDLVRYATLAPNGHNTQPWRFQVGENLIRIRPDLARRTPIVDPDNHHLFVSLGCAAENLSLAAAARGCAGAIRFDPAHGGSVAFMSAPSQAVTSALFDAIPRRQSTRADYDGRQVSAASLRTLAEVGSSPDVNLVLITDRSRMDHVRDLVVAGNDAQMTDPSFLRELKSWLRFNPDAARRTGDGLYSVASGTPALPNWLGPHAFDMFVTARSENDKYARQIRSSSGIAIFVAMREDPAHWVAVGQACQRFALQATALGLKHAFINQPVEVARLRPELAALSGLPGRRPDIVMRFGYGPTLPYSPRRPVTTVVVP
ncbi:Tat pathway signal protein [Sphingomonas sp. So64.6b]|uniref:Acg family FMN-binding oxidoreductase n=1 Tax=Sphingomonas sp. So64.6b TaxID=2997354 RepID=UPI001601375C|nr:nitroreductase family protein [Sphingomonas sp. So64.6b]QNA83736.1 Tat pathway signal protein [Sphingomonas sp. So64.6b]